MINKNELILDKVRSLTTHDLGDNRLLFRLTSLEDPNLQCTAEGEEVVDAIGSLITTLYRAKKANFSASNSLFSLDLAAAQYGTKKEIADAGNKIVDYTYEIKTVKEGSITLDKVPNTEIKYIYSIESGEIGKTYTAGAEANAENFVYVAPTGEGEKAKITVPTGVTGKIYVEYTYESTDAIKVTNKSNSYPEACSMIIYAYFKDKCNENITYSGKIICPKVKLNPEQIEHALTSTGKHPFEFKVMQDYCEEDGDLFDIIIAK